MLAGLAFLGLSNLTPEVQAQSTPNFALPVQNPFNLGPLQSNDFIFPHAVDIDGDGDLDIMAGTGDGTMNFYRNTGSQGNPNFILPTSFPFGFGALASSFAVHFADLDGDGDFDCLAGGTYGQLDFYENIGQANNPMFSAPNPVPFGLDSVYGVVTLPELGDLDGDGDLDLMMSNGANGWVYQENVGNPTSPNLPSWVISPFGLGGFMAYNGVPALRDLDQDGDLDILTSTDDGSFLYFENTGTPTSPSFASGVVNPFGLQPQSYTLMIDVADIDGDGDLDVIANQYDTGQWLYFENNPIVNIKEEVTSEISMEVYPNPTEDQITLSWQLKGGMQEGQIKVYDLMGRAVYSQEAKIGGRGTHTILLSALPQGTYSLELIAGDQSVRKKIVKQ